MSLPLCETWMLAAGTPLVFPDIHHSKLHNGNLLVHYNEQGGIIGRSRVDRDGDINHDHETSVNASHTVFGNPSSAFSKNNPTHFLHFSGGEDRGCIGYSNVDPESGTAKHFDGDTSLLRAVKFDESTESIISAPVENLL